MEIATIYIRKLLFTLGHYYFLRKRNASSLLRESRHLPSNNINTSPLKKKNAAPLLQGVQCTPSKKKRPRTNASPLLKGINAFLLLQGINASLLLQGINSSPLLAKLPLHNVGSVPNLQIMPPVCMYTHTHTHTHA